MIEAGMRWESIEESFDEFSPLFNAHYKEMFNSDIEVEKDRILDIESRGALYFLAYRDQGTPVGYYVVALTPTVYNSTVVEAQDIGIYVIPSKRGKGITTLLQKEMDSALKDLGVDAIRVSYPKESSIPLKAGYKIKEIIYGRDL